MATVNKKIPHEVEKTHGGAVASRITAVEELKRTVLACMLWEDGFYESGTSVADQIADLMTKVSEDEARGILYDAKLKQNLRHTPLYLLCLFAKNKWLTKEDVEKVCTRADDITELLALYWKDGKKPLPKQMVKGLQKAFTKFDEYQLAKYNRDKAVKLRDVMKMVRPKPATKDQEALWGKLIKDELAIPDTWEVSMSKCKTADEKKAVWNRLISDKKLGGLATLRNIRNMNQVGVSSDVIAQAIRQGNYARILPFQFTSAAKAEPRFENVVEEVFLSTLSQRDKLKGKTVVVIDVSGSMYGGSMSKNSEMNRALAGCTCASILREVCESPVIYATAGNDSTRIHKTEVVPARRGFALTDAIYNMCQPLGGGGIFLKQVCDYIREKETDAERMIIFTDEQDCSGDNSPSIAKPVGKRGYIINVSTDKHGIAYNKNWVHISGFSEACVDYILEAEKEGVKLN